MAEKDVLSQEEIDALLHSVDGNDALQEGSGPDDVVAEVPPTSAFNTQNKKETVKPKKGKEETPPEEAQVKSMNFIAQERIVRGQLPVLDKIYDRAMRLFVSDIYQLTGRDFEITQDPVAIIKHVEFMSSLSNPSLMTTYRFRPLRGKGLIAFDSTFVYDLVDYYFGGSSQFLAQKDKTDFTATEFRVMESVTKKLVSNLLKAWEPILELNIMKVTEETNPQLVHISEPNEMLLVNRFNVDFGQETGSLSIALPYSMIEPIKQQLDLGAARPDDEIDPNWIKSLKEELMDVEVLVSAAMAESHSSLGAVMSWQEGDFVPIAMKEIVTLDIEGTPSFTATLGSAGDKRALKIINKIDY